MGLTYRNQKSKSRQKEKILNCSSLKMMPHHGRNFEEEMSRFEAEINNARAAAFMAAGGGMAQVPMVAVTSASAPNFVQSSIINRNRPVQISAPPSGAPMIRAPPSSAVISAPPSNAVISAKPTIRTKDDDDILATLMKVEKEIKSEPKPKQLLKQTQFSAFANKGQARMMPSSVKKSIATAKTANNANACTSAGAPGTSAGGGSMPIVQSTPTLNTISDETVKKAKQKKRVIRTGGGQVWEDDTLKDWDQTDFRIFCGDLGNDVTDEVLARTFGRYSSFQKAKVIRDKRTNKTKGFGFISFKDPGDFTRAMREMNGKYVGSRPIKMRKSNWRDPRLL